MATHPAALSEHDPAQAILQAEAVRGEPTLESEKGERDAALWAVVHFLLVATLLVWPLISVLRDDIRTSLPILLGCYGAAYSMTRTSEWRWYFLSFLLVALGLVLMRFAIIQEL